MQGWVATQLFDDAATNVPEPTTSQAILNGLWTIRNDDLGGTTYPLTFVKGQDARQQYCGWLIEIRQWAVHQSRQFRRAVWELLRNQRSSRNSVPNIRTSDEFGGYRI
jgi:hypothetical protein